MQKKILYAKSKIKEEKGKIIKCIDLDKLEYNTKYRQHLKCINGCDVRIKFTERTDNVKFFSTWNKEGHLHDIGCPYHVEYKNKAGRKKLNAFYKSIELDDDTIYSRLKAKYIKLHNEYNDSDIEHPAKGSLDIENAGEGFVDVSVYNPDGGEHGNGTNIRYADAKYITIDDIGRIISVYGEINNAHIDKNRDGSKYAYLNLYAEDISVHILFTEAFYSHELSNGIEELERFIKKINDIIEKSKKPVEVIAFGEITPKKKREKGVNITVISPKRILINNMSYNEILNHDIK